MFVVDFIKDNLRLVFISPLYTLSVRLFIEFCTSSVYARCRPNLMEYYRESLLLRYRVFSIKVFIKLERLVFLPIYAINQIELKVFKQSIDHQKKQFYFISCFAQQWLCDYSKLRRYLFFEGFALCTVEFFFFRLICFIFRSSLT